MQLILASTSPYRRALLQRLGMPFEQTSPDFEEASSDSIPPNELVEHNTLGKARSVLTSLPAATIIASDQIAVCGEIVLGKPGTVAKAEQQLQLLSGKRVSFLTGLCLMDANSYRYEAIPYHVCFRDLSKAEIRYYVEVEQPLDCAGSFKSEGLGISLFEKMEGDDPTALIGLPLIRLSQWLREYSEPNRLPIPTQTGHPEVKL